MSEHASHIQELNDEEYEEQYNELLNEMDIFLNSEINEFKGQSILTQEQLVSSIAATINHYQDEANSGSDNHAPVYYATVDHMLKEFKKRVAALTLPEPLHDWWFYSYEITEMGIRLLLNAVNWDGDLEFNKYRCRIGQRFMLTEVQSGLMTVNDYAQRYDIQPVTVRQWIRRGKIRSAIKFGGEWRIPELFELSKVRGYVPSKYVWSSTLTDIPEKFSFLNNFTGAHFDQDLHDKKVFTVDFIMKNGLSTTLAFADDREVIENIFKNYPDFIIVEDDNNCPIIQMSRETREELELCMISDPLIAYTPLENIESQVIQIGLEYTGTLGFEIEAQ